MRFSSVRGNSDELIQLRLNSDFSDSNWSLLLLFKDKFIFLSEANFLTISNIVEDLADKLVNEADRNVSSVFFGFRTNNPLTGKNYFGVGSESVNPAVYEFRRLQLLLEQIETLQIDNCSPTVITITEEQG